VTDFGAATPIRTLSPLTATTVTTIPSPITISSPVRRMSTNIAVSP